MIEEHLGDKKNVGTEIIVPKSFLVEGLGNNLEDNLIP